MLYSVSSSLPPVAGRRTEAQPVFLDVMILLLLLGLAVLALWSTFRKSPTGELDRVFRDELERLEARFALAFREFRQDNEERSRAERQELSGGLMNLRGALSAAFAEQASFQAGRFQETSRTMDAALQALRDSLDRKLNEIRLAVADQLDRVRAENSVKLEEMRRTVDEKLHETLEKRLGESFRQVSERLEKVHQGLGEMQNLAAGVGDLKAILANTKTLGNWGEVQLGTLLEQILAPEQYVRQARPKPGSTEAVDYAIKLPGREEGDACVLLPVDAKLPLDSYAKVVEASERGDRKAMDDAVKLLETRLKQEARSIREKYVSPPHTTDFAILYLPVEGLYAEALRRPALAEFLQREYRVTMAGPTTLAALLNSLQMGFRTLAIQKRSSEVWRILSTVKKNFEGFAAVFEKAQQKIRDADKALDTAIKSTQKMGRTLKDIESLPSGGPDPAPADEPAGIGPAEDDRP